MLETHACVSTYVYTCYGLWKATHGNMDTWPPAGSSSEAEAQANNPMTLASSSVTSDKFLVFLVKGHTAEERVEQELLLWPPWET